MNNDLFDNNSLQSVMKGMYVYGTHDVYGTCITGNV